MRWLRLLLPVLAIVSFRLSSEAQVRLNFPRVLSAQELSTTGLAFVSTSNFAVTATFNFYGMDGTLIGQSPLTIPPKGQVAKLASEILSTVTTSTWIQVTTASTELQGFELVGDFVTLVDGAGPAPEATQLAVIDFSREDTVHLVNPGSQPATVQLTLNAANGTALTTRSVPLAAFQAASFRLGDLNNDDNIDLVSISANVPVSASLTTKLPGGADIGMTNAAPAANASSSLYFPFTPSGPQGASNWKALLGIANLASTSQTVSLTFNPDVGTPVTVQRVLSPGASVGDSVANLFSMPPETFTAGWIRVTGSGNLAGAAAYQDAASGSLAIVPSQSSGSTRFLFGHNASLSPWYTGIALLNTSTTAADAELFAIGGNGQIIGAASFSVAANTRRTALVSEFVPKVLERSLDGGWIFLRTTNNVPLIGFELFGHAISPILANVQGFALPSTSSFIPPSGGSLSAGVTIDPIRFTDSLGSPKNQFQPLDAILYLTTLQNPSGARGSGQFTYRVTDPRNQILFSTSSSVTFPASVSELAYVGSIPSNALTGTYQVTASLTSGGQLVTQSGAFDVTGGSTTPTAGQDPAISTSSTGVFQSMFRPGDAVRFIIPTANFTGQPVSSTINYQLTGPGSLNAGSGSQTFTMPAGVSSQTVTSLSIPSNAQQGLFAFSSALTTPGLVSTKIAAVSVVPRSSAESITIENVWVADSGGVPRAGFTAGSGIQLSIARLSTIPVSSPATVRYLVTGPNSSSVLDQSLSVNVTTGISSAFIPQTLSSTLAAGNYTFQGTITYQDSNGATATSMRSTTFTVGDNPAALTETITALRPNVRDINFVTRSSFSPAEGIVFYRAVYSTFRSPVTGTVRYQLSTPVGVIDLLTSNVTFNPGINVSLIAVTTAATIPAGPYSIITTATAQSMSSVNQAQFSIAGPTAPNLTAVSTYAASSGEISVSREIAVDSGPVVEKMR